MTTKKKISYDTGVLLAIIAAIVCGLLAEFALPRAIKINEKTNPSRVNDNSEMNHQEREQTNKSLAKNSEAGETPVNFAEQNQNETIDDRSEERAETKALFYLKNNDRENAELWLKKTLEINSKNQLAIGEITDLFIATKREAEAISFLRDIVSACKDSCADANLALGNVLLRNGDTDEAIEQLREATASDSVKEAALYALSSAYLKRGEKENATSALSEIVALKREHIKTLKAQGIDVGVLERSLREETQKILSLERKEG